MASCVTGDHAANLKVLLPKALIKPTIRWYHQVTGHPGRKRLYQHIHQWYHNHHSRRLVDNFKCNYCQKNKLDGKRYRFLPECEVQSIPFEECVAGFVGPCLREWDSFICKRDWCHPWHLLSQMWKGNIKIWHQGVTSLTPFFRDRALAKTQFSCLPLTLKWCS